MAPRQNRSLERLVASLDDSLELLGFGEALHGGEDILLLRNRLYQALHYAVMARQMLNYHAGLACE